MKFVRFQHNENKEVLTGVVTSVGIKEVIGNISTVWDFTGKVYKDEDIRLVSPIEPNQIIGVGANYVMDKNELPEELPEVPVFFMKPTSSVIGTNEEIVLPKGVEEVKFESELAVIIGKEAKDVSETDALEFVFGYTIANDVTSPHYFHPDGHWTVGKAFDTFTPLGPVVETELNILETRIESYHNKEKKQDSTMDHMIISVEKMISYLSTVMTLKPRDVILTGAPVGAGFLKAGDTIECKIDGIGSLENKVVNVTTSPEKVVL